MNPSRSVCRAVALAAGTLALAACSPNKPTATVVTTPTPAAVTVAAETPAVGSQSVDAGGKLPAALPADAVPLPTEGLVRSQANVGGTAKAFDLTYQGADLGALVADLRARLAAAGYTISDEYAATVKNVPSAGFVARTNGWIVTVGGTSRSGAAAVSVSVAEAA